MSTTNLALVYKAIPEGAPVDGVHLVVESRELDGAARPPSHGWIARLLHAGFDPYLRNLMKTPDESQGFPALELGSVINNAIIVEVLQSNREGIEPGHILRGFGPIQEHIVADADTASAYERLPNDGNMLLPLFLGCLGVSGLAGYSSFFEIGQPVSGETILITAAAGAIGQVVGQAARHVGLKVLGAVGSDEKLRLLTGRLGFHGGLNHRNGNLESRIHQLAPQGIDIIYDSVGGPILEAAIGCINTGGRIVACGYASQYNIPPEDQYGIRNTSTIIRKRVTWRGFDTDLKDFPGRYVDRHIADVSRWIKDGSFNPLLDITTGMENAAAGLARLLRGENVGKALLSV